MIKNKYKYDEKYKAKAKRELAEFWGSNIWEGDLEKMRLGQKDLKK